VVGRALRLSPEEVDAVWTRWRSGQAVKVLSRQMRVSSSTVRDLLHRTGGIRPAPRRRWEQRLSQAEREEHRAIVARRNRARPRGTRGRQYTGRQVLRARRLRGRQDRTGPLRQARWREVRSFTDSAFEVVVADVLTPATLPLYRERLPRCLVVRLTASLPVVLQGAATRKVGLTKAQVRARHQAEADDPPVADETIDVTTLNAREQVEAVERVWRGA
jgi:hypothetical protein